jgi:hypothetical protein
MTTSAQPTDGGEQATDYRPRPAPNCDPDLVDDFTCAAKGVQAQATYNAAHLDALDKARTQYKGARKAYSTAGDAAKPIVADAKKQLGKIIEQLECLIDDAVSVRHLDRACETVEQRLEACGDQSGCYCGSDCDFDVEVADVPADQLPATIADIQRRTKEFEDCFADLIEEPTSLTARVTAALAEVTDIATKISGNAETTDFRRLYAAALVTRRHLAAVWRGFADVNAFVDCLCQTLTCMLKGHAAIGELQRRAAVEQCHREAEATACTLLRTNTVDEVIAEYLNLADAYGEQEGDPGTYGSPDQAPEQDPGQYDGEPEQYEGGPRERYEERGGGGREGGDRQQYPRPDDRPRGQGGYRGPGEERSRYGERPRGSGPPAR